MVNKFHEKAKPTICLLNFKQNSDMFWHQAFIREANRSYGTKMCFITQYAPCLWHLAFIPSKDTKLQHSFSNILCILCFCLLQKTQYCSKADGQCSFHNEILTPLVNSAFVRDYFQLWIDTHKLLWKSYGTENKMYINKIC